MKLFISGTARFNNKLNVISESVKEYLREKIKENVEILIGDCIGVDTLVQSFLFDENYNNVTIYASGKHVRNNIGGWRVKYIDASCAITKYEFYSQKDKAMRNDCDIALALWDGKSKGTGENIKAIADMNKPIIIYNIIKNKWY